VDFEDQQFVQGQSPSFDASPWLCRKQLLGLDFVELPFFIDGDVKLTTFPAIMRHIARKYKPELLGESPEEQGLVSMLEGPLTEFHRAIIMPCYPGKPKDQIIEGCAPHLNKIYKWMGEK